MKFSDLEAVPGAIISVKDPLKLGRVKCAAPGIFDNATMDDDILPWVCPFSMGGYQTFSKPVKGAKVWVIKNNTNYNEFWYVPYFEMINTSKGYVKENYENDAEVLLERNNGDTVSRIAYDLKHGHKIQIGNIYINVLPNGDIVLNGADAEVKIKGGHVYTGKQDGSYQPAVMGNELKDILSNLAKNMNQLYIASQHSPYTVSLAPGFQEAKKTLSSLEKLLAQKTSIN